MWDAVCLVKELVSKVTQQPPMGQGGQKVTHKQHRLSLCIPNEGPLKVSGM